MAAALVSAFLGELIDAFVILFTVILAGVLGFVQEYRAEESIKLLKSLTSPEALVVRDGKEVKVHLPCLSRAIFCFCRQETGFLQMPDCLRLFP